MKDLTINRITIDRVESSDSVRVYVKYTYKGEEKTDNGSLFINSNSYYPSLDMDDDELEYDALQQAVEAR